MEHPAPDMIFDLMRHPTPVLALQTAFLAGFEQKPPYMSIPVFAASVWQPNAPPPGTIQIAVGPKQ
jgi:hypothetical protein